MNEIEDCPIGKLMWKLAVPSIIAEVVNIIYNIADRVFLGRIDGEGTMALAGLGIVIPLITFLDASIFLIGNGGAPLAAIYMGQRDIKKAQKIIGNSLVMLTVLAIIATVLFITCGELLLRFFGADADTMPYAWRYLSVYLLGTPGVVLSLGLNPFLTTQGANSISMRNVLVGVVLNCVLDPLFIYGFRMGIVGAAVATIIGQYVTAALNVIYLLSDKTKLKLHFVKPELDIDIKILSLGLSIFFIYVTESLVSVVFYRLLTRYGDYRYVTVVSVLQSISQIFVRLVRGTGQGAQPIMSYSYGAGNIKRLRETTRLLVTITGTISFVMTSLTLVFPVTFFRIYTNDKEIINLGSGCLRFFMWGQCMLGIQLGLQEMFRAIGFTKISVFIASMRKLVLLIPLSYILTTILNKGVMGVFIAEGVADFTCVFVTLFVYFSTRKKIGIKAEENLRIRQNKVVFEQ